MFGDWFGDCRASLEWCWRAHTSYTRAMPTYEFRCKTCDAVFEERRAMSEANDPAQCPQGHDNSVRLLSVFASVGATAPKQAPAPRSGGGCGGGCACH
jgi:putative FmdB family regulatory protein